MAIFPQKKKQERKYEFNLKMKSQKHIFTMYRSSVDCILFSVHPCSGFGNVLCVRSSLNLKFDAWNCVNSYKLFVREEKQKSMDGM